MKRRRRRSPLPRLGRWRRRRPERPWRGVLWTAAGRPEARLPHPGEHRRRALAILAAGAEVLLLLGFMRDAAFFDRTVRVVGAGHLGRAAVISLAGLQRPQSVFSIDPRGAAAGIERSDWVRSASVSVAFPDRVTIQVQEWTPVAAYRAGAGAPWLLSPQGVALGPAGSGAWLEIDGPAKPPAKAGQVVIQPRLLVALVQIQRQLPGLIGQQVRSFQIDSCGDLTMVAAKGWQAIFGRVLTPAEFESLGAKVAALKQIAPYEDFNSPTLAYVNVMNPGAVAVHHTTDQPSPAPSTSPKAPVTPSPSPTITPVSSTCA